jgi:hypothetical protein
VQVEYLYVQINSLRDFLLGPFFMCKYESFPFYALLVNVYLWFQSFHMTDSRRLFLAERFKFGVLLSNFSML